MAEWIEWKGGDCPVANRVLVDIKWSDGSITSRVHPWNVRWNDQKHVPGVRAYRLSEQQSMEEAYDEAHKEIGDSALDQQHGGDHYKKLGDYQPWEVLRHWLTPEEFRGYMKGEAITYLARERSKGGTLDIKKAAHTLKALLELEGK